MKIVKKAITDDSKTRAMFEVFDDVIKKLDYPWKMERLEFLIDDKNFVFVGEKTARITLNYNDVMIQDNDRKALFSIILHAFYHIIVRDKYNLQETPLPHFFEDIIANREMIKNGYDDLVFYLSFSSLVKKKHVNNMGDYLDVNVPWLSFYKIDDYNSISLRDMLKKIKNRGEYGEDAKKLIDMLKRDITKEKELNHALTAYEVMLCR